MSLTGTRTFVGFGFGAIQAGLFLYEAYQSGAFGRLVVAEVLPDVVQDVRSAGGTYAVNVAHADRVEPVLVGPIEIENPGVDEDRQRLIAAIAEAEELATAVPSVDFYASDAPGSLHRLLAEGLRRKASARRSPVRRLCGGEPQPRRPHSCRTRLDAVPAAERDAVAQQVRFVDTVIAKMSGVHEGAPAWLPSCQTASAPIWWRRSTASKSRASHLAMMRTSSAGWPSSRRRRICCPLRKPSCTATTPCTRWLRTPEPCAASSTSRSCATVPG